MKDYFLLQFKIVNRKMIDFGIPLLVGYTVLPLIFLFLSNYLFEKTVIAQYVYGLIALTFVSKLSDTKRNDFLKSIFSNEDYRILRIIENIICCLPFTLFLVYKDQFVFTSVLNLIIVALVLLRFNINFNFTIPTPFGEKPFEFTVGFRKTFYVFPVAYFLTYISIVVGNFNLGVFSMLLIGFTCVSYYSKIEEAYFVWNYNLSSKEFLMEKTKTGLIFFTLLSAPVIVALGVSYVKEIDILIVFVLLCYAYLIEIIFAKYASFPNQINMSQGVLIAVSLMFPPILVVFVPFFYLQSIKKLNTILND
jgi:hypothetical protein